MSFCKALRASQRQNWAHLALLAQRLSVFREDLLFPFFFGFFPSSSVGWKAHEHTANWHLSLEYCVAQVKNRNGQRRTTLSLSLSLALTNVRLETAQFALCNLESGKKVFLVANIEMKSFSQLCIRSSDNLYSSEASSNSLATTHSSRQQSPQQERPNRLAF